MDVKTLIDQYFDNETDITIDAFDFDNIYSVYHRIISKLSGHFEIEISVMQGLSYCFYEILDNVLTHSGKKSGVTMTSFNPNEIVSYRTDCISQYNESFIDNEKLEKLW